MANDAGGAGGSSQRRMAQYLVRRAQTAPSRRPTSAAPGVGGGSKVNPRMVQQGGTPAEGIQRKIENLLYRYVAPSIIKYGRAGRTAVQAYNAVPGINTGNPAVDNLNNTIMGGPFSKIARMAAGWNAQLAQENGRGLNAPPYTP